MACAVARRANLGIMPGAGIELMFDMDDVRFTDLVIAWQGVPRPRFPLNGHPAVRQAT
jgi:hypothetical protein